MDWTPALEIEVRASSGAEAANRAKLVAENYFAGQPFVLQMLSAEVDRAEFTAAGHLSGVVFGCTFRASVPYEPAEDDPLIRDLSWALFAGEDATYVEGDYQPGDGELSLARLFVETLAGRGWAIQPIAPGK